MMALSSRPKPMNGKQLTRNTTSQTSSQLPSVQLISNQTVNTSSAH